MKILHYFLGFPPYRSGGLTKYCCDLMEAQARRGDTVAALWPGRMGFLSQKIAIRDRGREGGVYSYELINPLPVPLDEGIAQIPAFIRSCDCAVFTAFLRELQPDAIHIHTLMGLYREFIQAANALGIPTVFTTHDYFGLCPRVTLYRHGSACGDEGGCTHCAQCNQQALSLNQIRLLQSPLYRKLKDSWLVKQLRRQHRQEFFEEATVEASVTAADASQDYLALRGYYVEILERMDVIHFNSTVAKQVYTRFVTPKSSRVISITHKDIADRREQPREESSVLRLIYLGPAKPFKGYNVLREALDRLWEQGNHNFELKLFGSVPNPAPYMRLEEAGYRHSQLGSIFASVDVLLAPSVWYETFGFTVLEALSYGVPVIISRNVGARDIVGNGGILVEPGSAASLLEAVESLTQEKLKTWDQFVAENDSLYCPELQE